MLFVKDLPFIVLEVGTAPIFEGVTSIQPINLIPLSEYSSPTDFTPSYDSRFVEIPDNSL